MSTNQNPSQNLSEPPPSGGEGNGSSVSSPSGDEMFANDGERVISIGMGLRATGADLMALGAAIDERIAKLEAENASQAEALAAVLDRCSEDSAKYIGHTPNDHTALEHEIYVDAFTKGFYRACGVIKAAAEKRPRPRGR